MAFRFNWPEFDAGFYDEAKSQLETALNKGNKPKNIVDHITVKELHMGSKVNDTTIEARNMMTYQHGLYSHQN